VPRSGLMRRGRYLPEYKATRAQAGDLSVARLITLISTTEVEAARFRRYGLLMRRSCLPDILLVHKRLARILSLYVVLCFVMFFYSYLSCSLFCVIFLSALFMFICLYISIYLFIFSNLIFSFSVVFYLSLSFSVLSLSYIFYI